MPPKGREKGKTTDKKKKKIPTMAGKEMATCAIHIPGPKYELNTLIGYKGHCISKFRNPAYTFGKSQKRKHVAIGPGPKYMPKERRQMGYTFGMATVRRDPTQIGPGPKYMLPRDRGLSFSLGWKTKERQVIETPGPYSIKFPVDAPAYTMGLLTLTHKVKESAGPYSPYNINVTHPKAPSYSMARLYRFTPLSRSPGPKYNIKQPKPTPAFSFGTKHSVCAPPYITKCDEQC
ncbi:outer dense fiber protein 3B-like [Harpegnathos saltator]|uniref:Outer dense fiber protein 3 n=1 Tax=Harpegnathos saltator TaxID=610380 RepID=E2C5F7_HARSA|nr:outer dense fiber protein 3B-like [Harpegnathos saltator]EFN76770.1 Outer dense fiber protein 3 [Harpegnathos saltator]